MPKKNAGKCSVPNCDRPAHARELCTTHYAKDRVRRKQEAGELCSEEGCTKGAAVRGLCAKHYAIRAKTLDGLPKAKRPVSVPDIRGRFEYYVPEIPEEGCTEWPGSTAGEGYGYISFNGRTLAAHRVSLLLSEGDEDLSRYNNGLDCDHICGNRACVNPKHLRWATRSQNIAHRTVEPRASSGFRGVYKTRGGRWAAIVHKRDEAGTLRRYGAGVFSTKEEAAEAARTKRAELFGEEWEFEEADG